MRLKLLPLTKQIIFFCFHFFYFYHLIMYVYVDDIKRKRNIRTIQRDFFPICFFIYIFVSMNKCTKCNCAQLSTDSLYQNRIRSYVQSSTKRKSLNRKAKDRSENKRSVLSSAKRKTTDLKFINRLLFKVTSFCGAASDLQPK